MSIKCLICRTQYERTKENTKKDSGFASFACPVCGYENTIEQVPQENGGTDKRGDISER